MSRCIAPGANERACSGLHLRHVRREEDLERVLRLRDHFYGLPAIEMFGVRRTRPFIVHVALVYFEGLLDEGQRARLVDVVDALNRGLRGREPSFHMPIAAPRAYDHPAEFRLLPGLAFARL